MAKQKLPVRTMRIRFLSLRADDDNVSNNESMASAMVCTTSYVGQWHRTECIETKKKKKRNCANQMHQMIILLFLII